MALQDKMVLIDELVAKMEEELTVAKMNKMKNELLAVLENYNVEHIAPENIALSEDYISMVMSAKAIEGRSPKTIKRYTYILGKLLEYSGVGVTQITVNHIRGFLLNEMNRGLNSSTLEGYRCIFSSIFGWLHNEGVIKINPTANLGNIKFQKKVRYPFSSTDIELLKERCKTIRDKAIVCFLLSTGARISEMCALNRKDIDFQRMECKVLGKGNKERIVYLDEISVLWLKSYLDSRKDDLEALFIGKRLERMTPDGIRVMLKQLEKKSGIPNVHPHRFRRTLATNLINAGMSVQDVARILGHENLNTTMGYIFIESQNVQTNFKRCYH